MTDQERFTQVMAVMMGIEGLKESFVAKWSPIIHGELTPEVRKWWAENLMDSWNRYLHACQGVWEHSSTTLSKQLDWRNLWKWMRENTDSWLYRKCTTCNGSGLWYRGGDKEFCISCNGTGRVARWDVEKWLEGK